MEKAVLARAALLYLDMVGNVRTDNNPCFCHLLFVHLICHHNRI